MSEAFQLKCDIENSLNTPIHFVNAIRIQLFLEKEEVDEKATVNVVRLCMFGKDPRFRISIGEEKSEKTWYTTIVWTQDQMDLVRHQDNPISLLESDNLLEDVYYLIFTEPMAFSTTTGTTNLIDYIDKTIKHDMIGSTSPNETLGCSGVKATKKKVNDFHQGVKTPYQREHLRKNGHGVKMPRKFQDMCHHKDSSHERIRFLLREVYLPKFKKMLRRPRPGYEYGGTTTTESFDADMAKMDRLAKMDEVEFDKRFYEDSSDIFISFARHVKTPVS